MKKMNLCVLIFILSIVLSFCHFNNSYFLMCFPFLAILLSYKTKYTVSLFLGMVMASFFLGVYPALLSVIISFGVCYVLLFLLNKTRFNVKIMISTLMALSSFILCFIQYKTLSNLPMINMLIAPILIYFLTYYLLDLQSDLKFKEKFSIDKKQFCFVAILTNLLISSIALPFDFEFIIFLSNIFNAIFIMVNPLAGIIGCVSGFICNLSMGREIIVALIPLLLILSFINKNKVFKIIFYLAINFVICFFVNNSVFLVETILSALIVVLIPSKLINFVDKFILEPQDCEMKLFQESYYRCLNRNKKVQKAIVFLENQIKESEKIQDGSMEIIRKDMQFLSDKLKEDDNFRIKENLLKRLEFLNVEILGFKINWDYFYNYKICLEIKNNEAVNQNEIIKNIESLIGVRLKVQEYHHNFILNSDRYILVNYQASRVNIEIKQRSKELNCCGDSYLSFSIKDKTYFLISDGMGHGKKANKISSEALLLLKEFIELGMDAETAIISCNAILYCRGEEQFNTLDLLEYDFFEDKINLYKNGSGCTYLKSKDKIEKIDSDNLPLGIVEEIKVKKESVDMKFDKIILTSDGFKKDLSPIISKNKSDKAKELIDDVLKFEGNVIDDDQTIVVISVIKN